MSLKHLAIIPDGNRRWAKAHLLLPWQGHDEGAKRFWEVADAMGGSETSHLTFWGGSYSNLRDRTETEVDFLFKLFKQELTDSSVVDKLHKNQIAFRLIGEWKDFNSDPELVDLINNLEEQTKNYQAHNLTILFGYDGQREMLSAISKLRDSGEEINSENLQNTLWTKDLPEVDLVIRTGGEPHWSAGFMMWLTANSQFYFAETLWPDFNTEELKKALEDFKSRERRLGK